MFKTFGNDDIIRNQGALNLNPSYTHIEQLSLSDVVCTSDLGRPIRNMFENEAELYMFLNSVSRELYQKPGVYPNSLGSAFTFNGTRDFKRVVIAGDTDKYYVRLSPGIAGFEYNGNYDKEYLCVNKPNRGICERQLVKAFNMLSKDGSENVTVKYDYINQKYKMRIVKSEADGTLYTYDFINDAASFDSDTDGKGYDTGIDLLAAIYTNATLRSAISVYQNRLDIFQLEPIFYIPSIGTYYIKINNAGKFVCNMVAPATDEFGLWSFVITGTDTLTIGSITDLRLMYTNGVHHVNAIRVYPLAETDDYASIYGEANGQNTIVHHQIGRDAGDKFVVEVNNGTAVSTIFEVAGDGTSHFTGNLSVDGNVTLGDSGTDQIVVRGDVSVKADNGTTNTFTVDNNTGNTAVAGTLVVTGNTTLNGSASVGDAIADNLSIFSTINTNINVADENRIVYFGGASGSTVDHTLTVMNNNTGHASLIVQGYVTSLDGILSTSNTTATLFNTNATTVSLAGAATTLNIANTATAAQTINIGTAVTGTQTINIGTNVDTNTAQNLYFGKLTNTVSTVTINPITASSTYSTGAFVVKGGVGVGGALNVYGNVGLSNALTVSGTTTLNGNLVIGDASTDTITMNGTISSNILVDDTNRTLSVGVSATNANRTFTIYNGNTTKKVDLYLDGDAVMGKSTSSTTTQIIANSGVTTANVFNTVATTLNIGGAATAISIGATTGTLTINNASVGVTGDLAVNGGDLTSSVANFNILNNSSVSGTINFGGSSSVINISRSGYVTNILGTLAVSGTTTLNGDVVLGDAGTDAITIIGDTNVKADDGTTNTFTIDNNTGNTTIAGTLGVTGVTTLSGNVNTNGSSINSTSATFAAYGTPTTLTFGAAATTITVGNNTNASTVAFRGTTVSSTTTTGAVTVAGGVGIAGAVNIGGNTNVGGNIVVTGNATVNGNTTLGNAVATDTITLGATFQSDLTFNDADRNIYLGGSAGSATNRVLTLSNAGTGMTSLSVEGNIATGSGYLSTAATTGYIFDTTATTLNIGSAATTVNIGAASGTVTFNNATFSFANATSTTFGTDNSTARTFTIHGTTTIGSATNTKNLTVNGATTITGITTISNTTASSAYNNGALVVSGGLGVAGAVFTNSNVTIAGNLTVNGTTYTVNSTTMTVDDPLIYIGGDTAPTASDALDRGVAYRWYDTANTTARVGFFGWDQSASEFIIAHSVTESANAISAVANYSSVRAYGFISNDNGITLRNTTTNINNLKISNGYTSGTSDSSLALNMNAGARTLSMSGNLTIASDTTINALTSGHVLYASGAGVISGESVLAIARGGLNSGTMTNYAVMSGGSAAVNYISPSTADYVLTSNGAAAQPSFKQVSLTSGVTGTLPTANGGTGNTSFTPGRLLYNSSSTVISSSNISSDGSSISNVSNFHSTGSIKVSNTGEVVLGYIGGSASYSPDLAIRASNGSAKYLRVNASANTLEFINSAYSSSIAYLNDSGYFYANRFYGAVYNDYADFVEVDERTPIEYGKAYIRNENYTIVQSNKYAQDGFIGIASDTYGQAIGTNDKIKQIPIAVAGWVLAYTDKIYHPGTPLVVAKDGTLTKANWFIQAFKQHKIVATFDRTELLNTWHDVEVNGRNWVKVR